MTYNPDTDRASSLDYLAQQSRDILSKMSREEELQWRQLWCSHQGGWVTRQQFVPINK